MAGTIRAVLSGSASPAASTPPAATTPPAAGLTMFDFQRLRRSSDLDSAPLLGASIFLDALNVFLFFLRIFSRNN